MKFRKAKKETVKEFQKKVDEFIEKAAPYIKKTVTVLGVVAAGSGALLMTGCSEGLEEEIDDEYKITEEGYDETTTYAYISDNLSRKEETFEKDLAKYLSDVTGKQINVVDMKDVKLVNSSGYYMVISGDFITDVKEGSKECSITLELTEEQYKNAEKFLQRYHWATHLGKSGQPLTQEGIAATKYHKSFIDGMKSIINDKETEVVAVYDKNNKEWVFDADEPTISNKR